jgi:hypothetical protein
LMLSGRSEANTGDSVGDSGFVHGDPGYDHDKCQRPLLFRSVIN